MRRHARRTSAQCRPAETGKHVEWTRQRLGAIFDPQDLDAVLGEIPPHMEVEAVAVWDSKSWDY